MFALHLITSNKLAWNSLAWIAEDVVQASRFKKAFVQSCLLEAYSQYTMRLRLGP